VLPEADAWVVREAETALRESGTIFAKFVAEVVERDPEAVIYINLVVEGITQSISLSGRGLASSLTLLCSRSEGDGVLEIGKKPAFSNKSERVERGRTHLTEMRLHIRRKSVVADKATDRLKLNEDKIGELGFCPSHEKT
jgi:hypothetical protein